MKLTIEVAILSLVGIAMALTMSSCISAAHAGVWYDKLKANPGPLAEERADLIFFNDNIDWAIKRTLKKYPEAAKLGLDTSIIKALLAGIAAKETHLGLRKFIAKPSPTRDWGVFQINRINRKAFKLKDYDLIGEVEVATALLLDNVNRALKNAKKLKDLDVRKKHVLAQAVMLYNNSKYKTVEALKEIVEGKELMHRGNPKYDTRNYLADSLGDLLLSDLLVFLHSTKQRKHIRHLRELAFKKAFIDKVTFMVFANQKVSQ